MQLTGLASQAQQSSCLMDWLCCLRCHRCPKQSCETAYYVSDCGHIVCKICRDGGDVHTCAECKKLQPQFKELTNTINIDPAVGLFFGDLLNWARKAAKFYEFQAYHMRKILCHVRCQDIDTSSELRFMDVGKLQSIWMQEVNYFSGFKVQYQQIMNLVQQIKMSGVSSCANIFNRICSDNGYTPMQVLIDMSPQSSNDEECIKSSDSGYSIVPPLVPICSDSQTTPICQHYGYNTPIRNKIGNNRLSVMPPPSDGRIATTGILSSKENRFKKLQQT